MFRKNTGRTLLALVLFVALILGVSGCLTGPRGILPEKAPDSNIARDEMMRYMKGKYNEDFTFVDIGMSSHMFYWTYGMTVTSAAFPDEMIDVRKESNGYTADNYEQIRLKADIEAEIEPIVYAVYGENHTFLNPQSQPARTAYSTDMDAVAYLQSDIDLVKFYIVVSKDITDKDNDVEAFRKELESNKYSISFVIMYIDETMFIDVTRQNFPEYYEYRNKEGVHGIGIFNMGSTFEITYSYWGLKNE